MSNTESDKNLSSGPSGRILSGTLYKKHPEDAGLDVVSYEDTEIQPRSSAVIGTNLVIAVPSGHVGLLWSRSGLSVKNNVEVGAGCIDSNYRGEVKVHLYNHGDETFKINIGDRIAQLLTIPINLNPYVQVDSLDETDRGEGGFGHTGKTL